MTLVDNSAQQDSEPPPHLGPATERKGYEQEPGPEDAYGPA